MGRKVKETELFFLHKHTKDHGESGQVTAKKKTVHFNAEETAVDSTEAL